MATTETTFMPASAETPSDAQRLFLRYFTGILIDLVVLNLFDEYSDQVTVSGNTHAMSGGTRFRRNSPSAL